MTRLDSLTTPPVHDRCRPHPSAGLSHEPTPHTGVQVAVPRFGGWRMVLSAHRRQN